MLVLSPAREEIFVVLFLYMMYNIEQMLDVLRLRYGMSNRDGILHHTEPAFYTRMDR